VRSVGTVALLVLGSLISTPPLGRAESAAPRPRSAGEELNIIRWKEDYGFLRDREEPTLLERLKFIPLNQDRSHHLTLGGQVRERVEHYDPSFLGLPGGRRFTSYATRLLTHADLHLGARVRTFVELGSYWEDGRQPAPRPIDVGDLELQQAFLDVTALDRALSRLTLRLGRQELPVGSGRLVSIRDGANVRLSFDAAKVTWARGRRTLIEATAGRPVVPRPGVFESESSDREWFWYADAARLGSAADRPALELFYVGHYLRGALYGRGAADETRHSVGSRVWGRPAPWDYSVQAGYQFGSFGLADIRAWGVATETGRAFASLAGRPRLAVRADIASGDGGDAGVLRTFNAPYPALNYFSEAAIFAPGNSFDLHPYLEVRPARTVAAAAGVDLVWRFRTTDAIYRAGGGILLPPGVPGGRFVTAITQLDGSWQPRPQIALRAAWVWASAGAVVRAAGGRHTSFLLLSLDLRL
jgi:Alginate export